MGNGVSDSEKVTTSSSSSSLSPPPSVPQMNSSSWQSPVPYLFAGLAAVLCIIIFALALLAFSFRRQRQSLLPIQKPNDSDVEDSVRVYEQKILVIMAGDVAPTYLATPVCARCSSLGNGFEDKVVQEKNDDEIHENSQQNIVKVSLEDVATTSSATYSPGD